ncbi:hypothetical protein MK805_16105 [Shimazuella sp. AN120528]|uniref:hypothetical protein n=1 Tax=Shimazuella soli TaxID=1892854 RepID=UPI001F10102B|nr:hypothetical protein [Shimazuella soli]MCH5586464.1 hypothetical protein [Shimazuella soli]
MKQHVFRLGTIMIGFLLLTACMYPQEERQQLADIGNHVARVQAQSEQYLQQHKTLPYKYSTDDRKFTSHYLVDFQLLPEIPMTAYEKGGDFLYVYVGAEGKQPLVRLFDLRVNDEVEKVQLAVNNYKSKNKSFPIRSKESNGFFDVDLEKLHMSDIKIPSPYFSEANLPILMDKNGRIFLDYRGDVTRLIQTAKQKPSTQEDLRLFMAKNSLFVPAFSPVLKVGKQGEILFSS